MRELPRGERGFTLVELIAAICIMAILAAVALPRVTAANPFAQRGYADNVAASLRRARAVAVASSCDVQFTVDAAGYRALQRAAAAGHCAAGGAFTSTVFTNPPPANAAVAVNRTLTFLGGSGTLTGAAVVINIGTQVINVDASGVVL